MWRRWLAAGSSVVALCLVGLLTAACTSSGAAPAPKQPVVPTFRTTSSAVPPPPLRTTPPSSCAGVASAGDVDAIVGHPLVGTFNQVVGVAEPAIHRTARLDCYYGVPLGKPVTAGVVSIGIASYSDATTAAHRAVLTVDGALQEGDRNSAIKVDTIDAVLLVGPKNQELVLSRGVLTILISANNGVLPTGKIGAQLTLLAHKALAGH